MKRVAAILLALVILTAARCSMFVSAPEQQKAGPKTVLVLWKESRFKQEVIDIVRPALERRGYTVAIDATKRGKFYRSADYGAVVYMAEYWMMHTPYHAKHYFAKNKETRNTLFVVTSGDPDIEIHKPFDAVTSASKQNSVQPVADEITEKLLRILK